jgi:methionyl-tRNA formyltransferase
MRVVFLGTPEFAVPALRMLLDNAYEVCAVFTQPDRPSGRGHRLHPGPVKALAQSRGIRVFQPERIRNEVNRPILEGLRPDFIVVAAYGQILPGWLLQSARIAPINIHGSLLPRYRGAAPIPWAILNGDKVTGVTTMVIRENLDSGPILLQQEIPIPLIMTAGELMKEISTAGADLLKRTLEGFQKNTLTPIQQDENLVTWAPRLTKEMAQISWKNPALQIHNQVRAMNPWPVAYADFQGEHLRIWRSLPEESPSDSGTDPGAFLGYSGDSIRVQCGEGAVLKLLEVQLPAKIKVSGREFASGARLCPGQLI